MCAHVIKRSWYLSVQWSCTPTPSECHWSAESNKQDSQTGSDAVPQSVSWFPFGNYSETGKDLVLICIIFLGYLNDFSRFLLIVFKNKSFPSSLCFYIPSSIFKAFTLCPHATLLLALAPTSLHVLHPQACFSQQFISKVVIFCLPHFLFPTGGPHHSF